MKKYGMLTFRHDDTEQVHIELDVSAIDRRVCYYFFTSKHNVSY